jgi:hypothetical protein
MFAFSIIMMNWLICHFNWHCVYLWNVILSKAHDISIVLVFRTHFWKCACLYVMLLAFKSVILATTIVLVGNKGWVFPLLALAWFSQANLTRLGSPNLESCIPLIHKPHPFEPWWFVFYLPQPITNSFSLITMQPCVTELTKSLLA